MPVWTDKQKRAIEADGKNLLVSAAAGSGKTAVLVERIIRKLLRRESPAEVTELLVVTFTRAAAAEMRVRIRKALKDALKNLDGTAADWPEEERQAMKRHLKKQLLLLPQAEICTMDSFFASMIRNYYQEIDLDPATRLADKNEMELTIDTVVTEFLEEEYADPESRIGYLSDYFGGNIAGNEIADQILELYWFSRNFVSPEDTLEAYLAPYRIVTVEELRASWWYRKHLSGIRDGIRTVLSDLSDARALLEQEGGLEKTIATLEADRAIFETALNAETAADIKAALAVKFPMIGRPSTKFDGDKTVYERAKSTRDACKGVASRLAKALPESEEGVIAELSLVRPAAEALIDLAKRFSARLLEEKKKRRIMDFNDQQHFVLDILVKDGEPTEVAKSLRDRYREILIDEYQDSNDLQEAILTSFARRNSSGEPMNVFMVGDIKQSIYQFRMAKPELFNEKHKRYREMTGEAEPERIELNANFRSRPGVTNAVNFFFRKFMREEVGGVEYDRDAELNPGGHFPETDLPVGNGTEILLATPEGAAADLTCHEAEAHRIAAKIREIVDPENGLYVKENEETVRRATYKDIVILLRATTAAETFREILLGYGIPTYLCRKRGFFSTFEVQFALHTLNVIDNPYNDIALAAVLRAPLIGVTSEELARVTLATGRTDGNGNLYPYLQSYAETHRDETADKLKQFFREIRRLQIISAEHGLSELLRILYEETGLVRFVTALPGGEERMANLNELITKAVDFEKTSLKGVFNFVRYVERMKERDEEGEVGTISENDDLVRIMTIHSSKGLEFPFVFVANTEHLFNKMAQSAGVLLHPDYGVGLPAVNVEKRTKKDTTFFREVMKSAMDAEAKGEELRLLYVAMTRAKEKLFLSGGVQKADILENYRNVFAFGPERLSSNAILGENCFLKWILAAYRDGCPAVLTPVAVPEVLAEGAVTNELQKWLEETELLETLRVPAPEKKKEALRELLGTDPHYDDLYRIYASLSVSALKQQYRDEQESEEPMRHYVRDERGFGGAALGTLYHKVLEHLDPSLPAEEGLAALRKEGLISEAEKGKIKGNALTAFLESDLGLRYRKAAASGKAFRETQFIVGRPAEEIYPGIRTESLGELVMIQGVIDLYFEEDDGLVIVDYKTDVVDDPEELKERYAVQLLHYKEALAMLSGKPVKETWIYSLSKGKEIRL